MKSIVNLIKNIYSDSGILYKNFIHWNVSKIIIQLASILLWTLLTLPFFIVLLVMYFSFWIETYLSSAQYNIYSLLSFFAERPFVFIFFMLFSVFAVLTFIFWYSYKKVLISKLNFSYLSWEKLLYMKNYYLNRKKFSKFVSIITLTSLLSIIPFLIFLVFFIVLFIIYWWVTWVNTLIHNDQINSFVIINFILFLLSIVSFLYFSYRMSFSVFIFMDEKNYKDDEKAIYYIKESISLTNGWKKILKFILVILLSALVLLPLSYITDSFSSSLKDLNYYIAIKSLGEEELKKLKEKSDTYDIEELEVKYWDFTPEIIEKYQRIYFFMIYLFSILNFILIYWLFEMVVISFYRNELLKKSIIDSLLGN